MICPSCNFAATDHTAHCIRCGFSFQGRARFLAPMRGAMSWFLRRALAGATTGMVGWCVIPAASRAAGATAPREFHLLLAGVLGGLFLGSVEGMLEESTVKTIRGGLAGLGGGLLGALLSVWMMRQWTASWVGMAAVLSTWACSGACIGALTGWLERKPERIVIGALAGLLGGAIGGWLGYEMFSSLMDMVQPGHWLVKRVVEGLTGAILGANLWLVIGLAEKFFIFKRRWIRDADHKECDFCQHHNPLRAWYCGACGSVLQEAAAPERLQLPKRQALARFVSACQFLARLAATTGLVVSCLAALFLGSVNPFLGLLGLLSVALISYGSYILLNTLAELLSHAL